MGTLTEFLSGINVWLAVALVDIALLLIAYIFRSAFQLIREAIHPTEYTEPNDYYEEGDPYSELYDIGDYEK